MKKKLMIVLLFMLSFTLNYGQTTVELIGNNDFESGLDGWFFNVDTTGGTNAISELDANSVITGTNSVKYTIVSSPGGSPSSRIALYVENISMEEGKDYNISFKIRSTKAYPVQWDIPFWTLYKDASLSANYDYGNVLVAKEDSTIQYESTYTATFTDTSIFSIDLGYFPVTDTVTIWIDDVSITTTVEVPPIEPAIVGLWTFNDASDLGKAKIGDNLEVFGSQAAVDGPVAGNGAILLGLNDYLKAATNIEASGAGSLANTYTLSMDIKIDAFAINYAALLQTTKTNNNDADLFAKSNKSMGSGAIGYSGEIFEPATWYRMVMVSEEHKADSVSVDIYLDGTLAYTGTTQNVDGRMALADSILLFRDNDGEEQPTDVSEISLYNYALTSTEVAALGDATNGEKEGEVILPIAPDGSGTEADPYQIATYNNLLWLQTSASEWIAGKYYVQTADIDASATATDGWAPLGAPYFSANYDGGGYSIDGLTMSGTGQLGFIESYNVGTVKNLGITNVNITKDGGDNAGALIAYMNNGTVENCYSTGTITSTAAGSFYGGLIGRIGDKTNFPIVTDSYSEVNLSGMLPSGIGGFAGLMVVNSSVSNCYSTGSVEGEDQVAGFVGLLEYGTVTKCYSTGNASANDKNAGGFVGYNSKGSVSECYSTGNVSGGRVTGGFVGQNYGSTGVISNCYSFGSVTPGDDHSGAFCGRNYKSAKIEFCYSTGTNTAYADRGFAGTSYGNGDEVVAYCFLDTTASGCTDAYAAGRSTGEMKTESTFTDSSWDFTSIWKVEGNYPNLINNPNSDIEPEEDIQDPLPNGKELITNYNFNDGLNNWNFYSLDTTFASYELDQSGVINGPNSVLVNVNKSYKGYPSGRIALFQGVEIKAGQEYHLTFKIKADKKIDGNAIWWAMYDSLETQNAYSGMWGQVSFDKDSTFKYEANFTADFTNATTDFSIDLAAIATDSTKIWIDDIHLIKLEAEDIQDPLPEGTELVANYNFNDGLNGWLFNNADSIAGATYSLDQSSVINGPNSVKVHMDTCAGGSPSGRTALYTQVPVEEGKEYYITFKMKATKSIAEWDLYWVFYNSVEDGSYYEPSSWSLATWSQEKDSTYKFELNYTPNFTNPDAYFSIDFGYMATDSVDFWLDDIHLIKLKEAEPSASRSLSFNLGDPRDEYVIAEDSLNFGLDSTWTMESWVKFANFDAPGGEDHIMRLGAQLFASGHYLKVQAGGNYVAGTTELVTDKWYHIAYVRTVTEVKVYLDGVEEIVAAGADAGAEAERFLLGSYGTPSTAYNFAGKMDEVRLWNVARTEAEINANKEGELTGSEDNLLIYYNFNDGSGNIVADIAGGDNDGELFNMADSNWSKDNPFDRPLPPDELPLPEGTELLTNNYFNDGLTNWDLNLSVQSAATLALDNSGVLEGENSGKVHVKTTYSSGSWKNQFRQTEMDGKLIEGNSYHVQFRIKSNKDINNIYAVVQQNHGSFSDVYSKEISLLADSMVTVVDTFVCAETDSMVTFAFNLGTASVNNVDVWFDAIHLIDVGVIVGVEDEEVLPTVYALEQNYPNPFNPTTVINFALPKASDVQLTVYNILGQKVAELIDTKMVAGNHSVNFNAANFASGVYIYRIQATSDGSTKDNFISVKKMLLLK